MTDSERLSILLDNLEEWLCMGGDSDDIALLIDELEEEMNNE